MGRRVMGNIRSRMMWGMRSMVGYRCMRVRVVGYLAMGYWFVSIRDSSGRVSKSMMDWSICGGSSNQSRNDLKPKLTLFTIQWFYTK